MSGPVRRARLAMAALLAAVAVLAPTAPRAAVDGDAWWPLLQDDEYEAAVAVLLEHLRREPQRLGLFEGRLSAIAQAEREAGRSGPSIDGPATPGARAAGLLAALDRAAAAARAAGRASPDLVAAHVLLSGVALEAGQDRRALEALQAVAHRAEAGPFLFAFASRCQAGGYGRTAADAYALCAAAGPDAPYRLQALLRQAELEEALGEAARASQLYRALAAGATGRPEVLEALYRSGRLAVESGEDLAAARHSLEQVIALDRSGRLRPLALRALAEHDVRAGDLESARQRYGRLLEGGGESAAAWAGLAEIAFYQGQFAAAVDLVDSLLALDPAHEGANDGLELQLLVDEYGSQAEALGAYARARLLERRGRAAEAARAWEEVGRQAPGQLHGRGLLYRARQCRQPGDALPLYEQVAAAWPDTPLGLEAQLGRAAALERLGRGPEALAACERVLLAFPQAAQAPEVRLVIQRLRQLQVPGGPE